MRHPNWDTLLSHQFHPRFASARQVWDSSRAIQHMSDPYEEIVNGERLLRLPPRPRHEDILVRLHKRVAGVTTGLTTARLLGARTRIELSSGNAFRPDLAIVTAATGKLWLVAEIISSDDHHADTVDKKSVYEEIKLPRLWMVDPRYDNVEIYHGTPYGLSLKRVLAGRELLTEALLPGFQYAIHELFAGNASGEPGRYDF
jgi:Uma2 family endonuclease